jgi:hypothetical protein
VAVWACVLITRVQMATWINTHAHIAICIYPRGHDYVATRINACGYVDTCNYGTRPRGRASEIHVAKARQVDLYTWPHGLMHVVL